MFSALKVFLCFQLVFLGLSWNKKPFRNTKWCLSNVYSAWFLWFWKSNLRQPAVRYTFKVRAGPIWANLEPVGFIISTFRSNLGGGGFYYFNFSDPQNDRFLPFSPCKTAKRVQKNSGALRAPENFGAGGFYYFKFSDQSRAGGFY